MALPGRAVCSRREFVEAHGGRLGDITIYGQENNATTSGLALMNLAIRGIETDSCSPIRTFNALPGQLFYSTQIPVCLCFLAKNDAAYTNRGFRDRRKQALFIDARKLGTLIKTSCFPTFFGSNCCSLDEATRINPPAHYIQQ